jgi:hypothetical protein
MIAEKASDMVLGNDLLKPEILPFYSHLRPAFKIVGED